MDESDHPESSGFRKLWDKINPFHSKGPVVPVIRLSGVIGAGTPLRQGLSLEACAGAIERAFAVKNAPAVVLQINSPGGSPVQSRFIHDRIRALATEKSRKVFAFAEDVAASGGYMLACAADEIYADGSSLVGSIGVVSSGFGFTDLIGKIGVERRVYTSGENKATLDPFKPENPDEIARLKKIQEFVHEDFIALVKEARGSRLTNGGAGLFTGEFWSGRQALELGLIDGVMDARTKMRALYGEHVRLKVMQSGGGLLKRRLGLGAGASGAGFGLGHGFADDLISALEARAFWARYGL
jgi:signal peptide peptidase SppA